MILYQVHQLINSTRPSEVALLEEALKESNPAPKLLEAFRTRRQTDGWDKTGNVWTRIESRQTFSHDAMFSGPEISFGPWILALKMELTCDQIAMWVTGHRARVSAKATMIYFLQIPSHGTTKILASATPASLGIP